MAVNEPKKDKIDVAIDVAYEKIIPGLTKFAVSAVNLQIAGDVVAFGSHVFQRRRSVGLVRALADEWEASCKEQRIKSEFLETEEGQVSLQELLDYLDKDLPNEEKFRAMKSIFFHGAASHNEGKPFKHATNLIRLCRQLAPEEILILGVCHKAFLDGRGRPHLSADSWQGLVAEYSDGLVQVGVVEFYEQTMVDHRLIADRIHGDRSGIGNSEHFRLARLGMELAEYIRKSP
jgi:hypothetical protein